MTKTGTMIGKIKFDISNSLRRGFEPWKEWIMGGSTEDQKGLYPLHRKRRVVLPGGHTSADLSLGWCFFLFSEIRSARTVSFIQMKPTTTQAIKQGGGKFLISLE
jgi:hypothetical protein